MLTNDMHAIVITCLEPWVSDVIKSVNDQTIAPDGKHLLVDSRFATDEGLAALDEMSEILSGWTIYMHDLDNDFSAHKNWVLDQLPRRNEWVLLLDADETIDKNFFSTAKDMTLYSDQYSTNKVDAYAMAMIHTFDGRDGNLELNWLNPGTWLYPDWHIKLFRNTHETRYRGMVHEILNGFKTVVPVSDPKMTLMHRKNDDMQQASNKRWRRLEVLRRENDPSYLGHLQGEDWKEFANEFEENIVD